MNNNEADSSQTSLNKDGVHGGSKDEVKDGIELKEKSEKSQKKEKKEKNYTIKVKDLAGNDVQDFQLPESIFSIKPKSAVLHSVVKAYQAARRQGTHAVKNRSLIAGSGKKPFKQKGTGNARQGSIRAVNLYHGAVAHGPQPRSYNQSVNKKLKSLALKMSLADRFNNNKLLLVDNFAFSSYSTKNAVSFLTKFTKYNHTMIVDECADDFLLKSVQNLYRVDCQTPGLLNAEHVLSRHYIIFSKLSLKSLIDRIL